MLKTERDFFYDQPEKVVVVSETYDYLEKVVTNPGGMPVRNPRYWGQNIGVWSDPENFPNPLPPMGEFGVEYPAGESRVFEVPPFPGQRKGWDYSTITVEYPEDTPDTKGGFVVRYSRKPPA